MKNHPLNWILNISHSDITLYYRYKLLLLKNVSPSCCSQLLSTGVIYSMANPDVMNAYLPPGKVLVLRSARRPAEHLQLLCHWQGLSGQLLRSPAPSKGQNHTVIYLTRDGMKGASGGKEGHNAVKNCFHHSGTDFNEKYEKTALKLTFTRGFKSIWTSYPSRDNCSLTALGN